MHPKRPEYLEETEQRRYEHSIAHYDEQSRDHYDRLKYVSLDVQKEHPIHRPTTYYQDVYEPNHHYHTKFVERPLYHDYGQGHIVGSLSRSRSRSRTPSPLRHYDYGHYETAEPYHTRPVVFPLDMARHEHDVYHSLEPVRDLSRGRSRDSRDYEEQYHSEYKRYHT